MDTTTNALAAVGRTSSLRIRNRIIRCCFFLLVLLLGFFSTKAQSHAYHEDHIGCIRVMYLGKKDDGYAIRLIVQNKKEERIRITLSQDRGEELYSETIHAEMLDRTFVFDEQEAIAIFKVSVAGKTEPQLFHVAFRNKMVEGISVHPLTKNNQFVVNNQILSR